MKTKITLLCLALSSLFTKAQVVADFESFTLTASSAYTPAASTPFETSNAVFRYTWNTQFSYWSGGCSYTNIQDSVNAYPNLHGVRALKGYSSSATYVVAKDSAIIKLKAPFDKVDGFYITNTTYAYKSIKKGDGFARKFGDTTGTKSPTTMVQGTYPDFFKVTVRGYKNGSVKPDSAVFYLADYRFSNSAQDYVVDTWQWFNTSSLGSVDSIRFVLFSSDNSAFGMNTPGFFAIDNFSTSAPNPVGLNNSGSGKSWSAFPNPFNSSITLTGLAAGQKNSVVLRDVTGKEIVRQNLDDESGEIQLSHLAPGIYFMEIAEGEQRTIKKLIKE